MIFNGYYITDIRVPADAFPLGQLLQEYPDIEIELEQLVPTEEEIIPLFWIESNYEEQIRRTLEDDALVEELAELTRTPDRVLFSVNWRFDTPRAPIVAIENQCTPDRTTAVRSVCKSFQLLL